MRKSYIAVPAFAVLVGFIAFGLWPDRSLRWRDLNCAAVSDVRAQAICRSLEREMQWTWLGHAIIAPGWRVGIETVRRTYCAENVSLRDVTSLETLRRSTHDWRAELGAEFLIRLVRNKDGMGDEPENSIFNPKNPSFILKNGCVP